MRCASDCQCRRHGNVKHKGTPEQRLWARIEVPTFTSDCCWLWTGATNDQGYGQITVQGKRRYVHRMVYEQMRGTVPPLLDHRHTCPKTCVNPDHLRPATKAQNGQNHAGPTIRSKSGIRGVYQHECGKWYGQVRSDGVVHGTGLRSTKEEAAEAVLELRNRLHTHNDADRVAGPAI